MDEALSLFAHFADLLEYPTVSIYEHADRCVRLLADQCPTASEAFSGFHRWVDQEQIGRVEEIYTSAFDLQGVCCPYVGYHLFGDSYKRSLFMAQLNHGYHEKRFSCGCELPDHLVVILRFLARGDSDEFSQALLSEGLASAIGKMVQAFDADGAHPYGQLIKSLNAFVQTSQLTGKGGRASTEREG